MFVFEACILKPEEACRDGSGRWQAEEPGLVRRRSIGVGVQAEEAAQKHPRSRAGPQTAPPGRRHHVLGSSFAPTHLHSGVPRQGASVQDSEGPARQPRLCDPGRWPLLSELPSLLPLLQEALKPPTVRIQIHEGEMIQEAGPGCRAQPWLCDFARGLHLSVPQFLL